MYLTYITRTKVGGRPFLHYGRCCCSCLLDGMQQAVVADRAFHGASARSFLREIVGAVKTGPADETLNPKP